MSAVQWGSNVSEDMPKGDIHLPNETGIANRRNGQRVDPYDVASGKALSAEEIETRVTQNRLRRSAAPPVATKSVTRAETFKRNLLSGRQALRGR